MGSLLIAVKETFSLKLGKEVDRVKVDKFIGSLD